MRVLLALLLAAGIGLTAGGCQTLTTAYHAVTGTQISVRDVSVAATAFDGLKATGTNYLNLPRCDGTNGPICAKPKVAVAIVHAIDAGTIARDKLEAFAKAHPDQLGSAGLYDALGVSISTLQGVFSVYNIGGQS